MRRGLTWLLVLPAIVVGSQLAHDAAYWWAYPQASLRLGVLSRSGHGYFAYAPAVLAFLAAVELLAFVALVVDRLRGRPGRALPAWVFLVVPEVGFVLQEHLERLLATGVFPWWAVLEPSFWRGLVLQVPLGIAAFAVASLLLRSASAVADAIVAHRQGPRVGLRPPRRSRRPQAAYLPRLAPLAARAADRGPPLALV